MHSYPPFALKKSATWLCECVKDSKFLLPGIGQALSERSVKAYVSAWFKRMPAHDAAAHVSPVGQSDRGWRSRPFRCALVSAQIPFLSTHPSWHSSLHTPPSHDAVPSVSGQMRPARPQLSWER
jgi:hypothetical protein